MQVRCDTIDSVQAPLEERLEDKSINNEDKKMMTVEERKIAIAYAEVINAKNTLGHALQMVEHVRFKEGQSPKPAIYRAILAAEATQGKMSDVMHDLTDWEEEQTQEEKF